MRSVLRNPTFRRLFAGRLVTNAGDSLYYIAAMWLVWDLGGSAFFTGLAGFLTQLPQALQFLTGPLVDRWPLRRILVGTQAAQGVLVLVIPVAFWTGWLSVWVVLVVMPVLAFLNQFVYPAQSAALPRIVDEDELVEANSAFSFAYQGTDLVFTAAGGVLVALVGAVALYVVDSVTFAAATLVFAGLSIRPAEADDGESVVSAADEYLHKLAEGVGFVRGSLFALIMIPSVVVNFTFGATMAVMPGYADLLGGAGVYGFLLAGVVGGMLVGSLAASPLKRLPLSRLGAVGFLLSGVTWLGAVAADWLPATVALFFVAMVPVGVTNVIISALIQSSVPEQLLGRVSALVGSASTAAMPVGSLLGGAAGDVWGIPPVMAAVSGGMLFLAAFWVAHPLLRGLPAVEAIDPGRYGLTAE
ncbi:MFS transporter [Halobacteriaceae archaeon GCM10025711]